MNIISVIVPVYNAKNYIVRCVESILEQTVKDIELILVDDGSTDGSGLICDSYEYNSMVKVIHQENRGVSSARNKGIEMASGAYIAFVDSDDYLEKNMFQQMLNGISGSDLAMCGYYKQNKQYQGVPEKEIVDRVDAMINVIQNEGFKGFLWNKLFKKSVIDKYKLTFSENIHMCEDLLFCAKYINVCSRVCFLPDILYHYVENENSVSGTVFNLKQVSIIEAYNELLKIDVVKKNSFICEEVKNRKVKHCLSLYYRLGRKESKIKDIYGAAIKQEIKQTNWDFLWAKGYGLKYKLLYVALKMG